VGGRIVIFGTNTASLADTEPGLGSPRGLLEDLEPETRAGLLRGSRPLSAVHGSLAIVATHVQGGDGDFTLLIAKRLDDTRAAVSVVRAALPAAAAAGLGVALLLALILSRGLVRRLRRLAADAEALGSEGLGHVVTVGGRDEVATVADSLEAMRSRLAGEESARVAFLATASHELRTPLTSLQATLELLREETLEDPSGVTVVERTDMALRQTHRLVTLASELLELSRVDSEVPADLRPVEVLGVAEGVVADFHERYSQRGRTLELSGQHAVASATEAAVSRVTAILIDNALQHGAGDVRVTVERVGERVEVAVEDQGAGVDPRERERVFGRFERGSAVGSAPGAGLGLAIARAIAESVGATLDVTARPPMNRFELMLNASPTGS
jgi:signal transduction histidine kinase